MKEYMSKILLFKKKKDITIIFLESQDKISHKEGRILMKNNCSTAIAHRYSQHLHKQQGTILLIITLLKKESIKFPFQGK